MDEYNGFTLVEVLIYTFLLGLIITGFLSFALVISRANNKNLTISTVNIDARNILTGISGNIRQADSVIIPTKGNSGSIMTLSLPNGGLVSYYTDNGILYRQTNGNSPLAIMDDQAVVDNISFYNLSGAGEPDNIRLNFTLYTGEGASPEFNYQQSLQTTIGIRR